MGIPAFVSSLFAFSVLFPHQVDAFWFFSNVADAQANAIIPSPLTPVLAAATNVDPNPNKGLGADLGVSGGSALLSYAGPSGTVAEVASTTPSADQISVYTVRPGDTLSEIGAMFNVSINTIVWANGLGSSKAIHPGQTLVILPVSGVERTVVKGDTLKSLAKKYGSDANEIAEFNGLDPEAALAIGSTVIIPGGELAVPVPAKTYTSSGHVKTAPSEPYLGGSGAALPGFFVNPIPGAIITQGIHGWNGIDLGAAKGTPIRAAAAGTVIIARSNGAWNGGYGNYVVISHAKGVQTLYAHMTSAAVSSGTKVRAGQVIGYVGSTGLSTGAHLHFEVRGAKNPFASCAVRSVCSPQ